MPLKRSLSIPLLTFYGLGTIIGAGIYALIGLVAQEATEYTPCHYRYIISHYNFCLLVTSENFGRIN